MEQREARPARPRYDDLRRGAMAVTYDENVILTFAERLYRRAASTVIAYALLGALIGALAGAGIAFATKTPR